MAKIAIKEISEIAKKLDISLDDFLSEAVEIYLTQVRQK